MAGELKDHIKTNISRFYRRRIPAPAACLLFIIILSLVVPLRSFINPAAFQAEDSPRAFLENDRVYVRCRLENLCFTGYRKQIFGGTLGYYYYYTDPDGRILIALLSGKTCDQGQPTLDTVSFTAKITRYGQAENDLLTRLSADLSWSGTGLAASFPPYLISEPAAGGAVAILLKICLLFVLIYASVSLVLNTVYTLLPELSPPVQRLYVYGHPRRLLARAETELSTLPQLLTEDMYITQHFFIETSKYGIAIVPISAITWIYKYSTLHRFLWHVSAISYTLYITTNHHQVIKCPKNIKSDIDGVMDYLAEANHNILVGFNEKNREAARRMEDSDTVFERLKKFMGQHL